MQPKQGANMSTQTKTSNKFTILSFVTCNIYWQHEEH